MNEDTIKTRQGFVYLITNETDRTFVAAFYNYKDALIKCKSIEKIYNASECVFYITELEIN